MTPDRQRCWPLAKRVLIIVFCQLGVPILFTAVGYARARDAGNSHSEILPIAVLFFVALLTACTWALWPDLRRGSQHEG